jgi:Domain of unknown function (DUF4389)
VRLTDDLVLRRRRLAVLFRPLLLIPAAIVALVWGFVAAVAAPLAWLAALVTGRVPRFLHRTLRAALGYLVQVDAWATLVTGRYPWPRRRSRHPVQLLCGRERQRRWTVLLRPALVLPALVLASVLGVVHLSTAVAAWFVGLVLGRTTAGLRELGAFCLRYATEAAAYVLLLTPRYPRLAPRHTAELPPVELQSAAAG